MAPEVIFPVTVTEGAVPAASRWPRAFPALPSDCETVRVLNDQVVADGEPEQAATVTGIEAKAMSKWGWVTATSVLGPMTNAENETTPVV